MSADLYRSQDAISAMSAKSLAWDTPALDSLTALGMCAVSNPMGEKLLRFISHPNRESALSIIGQLTVKIERAGLNREKAENTAIRAFTYWNNRHCPECGGRGVLNFEQETCKACGGTGDNPIPSMYPQATKDAISYLLQAEQSLELQLRAKLRQH